MRKPLFIVAAFVLLVGITATWPRERAMGQAPAAVERWEYGVIYYGTPPAPSCTWSAPGISVSGNSEDVYKAIGGKSAKGVRTVELLNLLGSQGWELAEFANSPTEVVRSEWWFKRRAR